MAKNLLFISFLFFATIIFCQETLEKIYATPNPFTDVTNIKFNSTKVQSVYFIVKNVLGKTVFKKTYISNKGKNTITFNRNNLKSGMYIYVIQGSKELISKRFVIK